MKSGSVPVRYVHSRITLYYSSLVDLRWQRSVHSCALCDLHPLSSQGLYCGAIHYGLCTAVVLAPAATADSSSEGTTTNGPKPHIHILRQTQKEDQFVPAKDVKSLAKARGEPDGDSDTFLRQKEAQLREKRERERDKERRKEKEREKDKLDKQKIQTKDAKTSKTEEISKSNKKKDVVDGKQPSSKAPPVKSAQTDSKQALPRESKNSLQKLSAQIPRFYFPQGAPGPNDEFETTIQRLKEVFSKIEDGKATKSHAASIAKACGLPMYWKRVLFIAAGGEKAGSESVTLNQVSTIWKKVVSSCHDESARFLRLVAKPGCRYLEAEDFVPLVQDVVDTHPGLTFLQDAPEFHSRYVHTVIARIFYCVNRSWSGRITVNELRRSNFLQTVQLLEEEDDINQIPDYFSYEHFYVIYCKFWELDKDHDLFINREDLAKHNDHALSSRMIDRIFSGAVTRGRAQKEGKMSYTEFVWFLISEEDKRHPTSIEYWFRCMDLDGDGSISMYEMEYFYEEMVQRMEAMGIETLPFEDCLCQMLDMVKPKNENSILLSDLKTCKMTPLFFDTFCNLEKYLEHEQKDPFANVKEADEPEMSDWERYAAEEYEILVAEEGANDMNQDELTYEDDFEPEEDEELIATLSNPPDVSDVAAQRKLTGRPASPKDDIYDFSTEDLGY